MYIFCCAFLYKVFIIDVVLMGEKHSNLRCDPFDLEEVFDVPFSGDEREHFERWYETLLILRRNGGIVSPKEEGLRAMDEYQEKTGEVFNARQYRIVGPSKESSIVNPYWERVACLNDLPL